jgi:hypothetical protein
LPCGYLRRFSTGFDKLNHELDNQKLLDVKRAARPTGSPKRLSSVFI